MRLVNHPAVYPYVFGFSSMLSNAKIRASLHSFKLSALKASSNAKRPLTLPSPDLTSMMRQHKHSTHNCSTQICLPLPVSTFVRVFHEGCAALRLTGSQFSEATRYEYAKNYLRLHRRHLRRRRTDSIPGRCLVHKAQPVNGCY